MALGEFEQLILLAVLQLQENAFAPQIAQTLQKTAQRRVTRGALYATLERLERKGFLRWEVAPATAVRSGNRKRRFEVTPPGLEQLRRSRETLLQLWRGLDDFWGETSR